MKKLLLFTVLILFFTGCSQRYAVTDNEETSEMLNKITSLKNDIKLSPADINLRNQIASEIYNLDLERAKLAKVKDYNQPFFINSNSNASVLLIHGFTASPWEVKELGERLAEKGYNVYGVLLAGHGTDRSELRKTKWQDWYNSVKKACEALSYISDKVFIVGVSTGGALGLLLAEEYKIDGVVCMACPVTFKDKRAGLAPLIKYFYWYQKRELKDEEKQYYYEYRPMASIDQLGRMINIFYEALPKLNTPILLLQSRHDQTIDTKSAELIYNKINSTDKKKIYFETDNHVLTKGENKDEVFNLVFGFINARN